MTVKLLTSGLAGFAAGVLAGIGLGYWHGFDAGYDDGLDSTIMRDSVPSVGDMASARWSSEAIERDLFDGNGGAS